MTLADDGFAELVILVLAAPNIIGGAWALMVWHVRRHG